MLQATILGNLGADATKIEGTTFASFVRLSVAHTERYTDHNGVQNVNTIWVNVIINWNCDKLLPYLTRGTKVYATGRIKMRAFNKSDGSLGASLDIIANTLELCGGPRVDTMNEENESDNPPF